MKNFIVFFLFLSFLFADENISIENNSTLSNDVVVLDDYVDVKSKPLNIAVVVNKKKFSRYLPNLINSINAYLIYKNVDYNLSVYSSEDNLSKIKDSYIIYVDTKKSDLNQTLYYPNLFLQAYYKVHHHP